MGINYENLYNALCELQQAEQRIEDMSRDNTYSQVFFDARLTVRKLQRDLLEEVSKELKTDYFDPQNMLTGDEAETLKRTRNKIQVIKMLRERTGCGLKEAKDRTEAWMQRTLGFTSFPSDQPPIY